MAYKGRITRQVSEAISLLIEEGSIVVPMDNEQYEASKNYKICIVEDIHKIQKDINWQVQMRLYEAIRNELIRQDKKITSLPDEGIIRLK
jgi:hypothetical protein